MLIVLGEKKASHVGMFDIGKTPNIDNLYKLVAGIRFLFRVSLYFLFYIIHGSLQIKVKYLA